LICKHSHKASCQTCSQAAPTAAMIYTCCICGAVHHAAHRISAERYRASGHSVDDIAVPALLQVLCQVSAGDASATCMQNEHKLNMLQTCCNVSDALQRIHHGILNRQMVARTSHVGSGWTKLCRAIGGAPAINTTFPMPAAVQLINQPYLLMRLIQSSWNGTVLRPGLLTLHCSDTGHSGGVCKQRSAPWGLAQLS
jgi:hypothetical protein